MGYYDGMIRMIRLRRQLPLLVAVLIGLLSVVAVPIPAFASVGSWPAGQAGLEGEVGWELPTLAPKGGDEWHLPGDVPGDFVVVKGGTKPPPGPGVEFSTSYGPTIEGAGAGVPHGQIQATTAAEIRASGGTIQVAPELTGDILNYQHANVIESGSQTVFKPTAPNPVPKPKRIGGPGYGK
jgi:hypothetical protein